MSFFFLDLSANIFPGIPESPGIYAKWMFSAENGIKYKIFFVKGFIFPCRESEEILMQTVINAYEKVFY